MHLDNDSYELLVGPAPGRDAAYCPPRVREPHIQVIGALTGLSLLFRAESEKHGARRSSLSCVIAFATMLDDIKRREEEANVIFRKNEKYAKDRTEKYDSIRKLMDESTLKDCTFKPSISDYAKQCRADMKVNDYFPRGNEWRKQREKKLEAKRHKLQAEQQEADDAAAVLWQMSPKSKRLLNKTRTVDPALSSRSQHTTIDDNHHTPTISSASREIAKNFPPFEYRWRVDLEKRKNLLREHEHNASLLRNQLGRDDGEHPAAVCIRSAEEIEEISCRLFDESTKVCKCSDAERNHSFHPKICESPLSPKGVSPRYLTPTRRQAKIEAESRQRRCALEGQAASTLPDNVETQARVELTSEMKNFLVRRELWMDETSRNHKALEQSVRDEQKCSFHPVIGKRTEALVSRHFVLNSLSPVRNADSSSHVSLLCSTDVKRLVRHGIHGSPCASREAPVLTSSHSPSRAQRRQSHSSTNIQSKLEHYHRMKGVSSAEPNSDYDASARLHSPVADRSTVDLLQRWWCDMVDASGKSNQPMTLQLPEALDALEALLMSSLGLRLERLSVREALEAESAMFSTRILFPDFVALFERVVRLALA